MPLARRIALALTGLAGAAAMILTLGTAHQAKPAHIFDGTRVLHAQIYGDTVKAPSHIFDG
jgi:hypothetical protein